MIFSQPISERRRRGSPKPQHVDKKGVAERHQHHTSQPSTPSSNVTTRLAAAALAARLTYQADYQHDDGSAQRRDLVGRPECPEGMSRAKRITGRLRMATHAVVLTGYNAVTSDSALAINETPTTTTRQTTCVATTAALREFITSIAFTVAVKRARIVTGCE
jgi:hypothetical protein